MADVRKSGPHGLEMRLEDTLDAAVDMFGDTWFTVSMYCIGRQGASAAECVKDLNTLHACGCVRKPDNDGGQQYFQVIPGIVYPKKSVGARS